MQQQQLAREQDTFEVVAFLRAENDTLQERLKHFEGKLLRRHTATPRAIQQYKSHDPAGEVSRAKRDAENEKQRVLPLRIAVCVGSNRDAAAPAGKRGSR